MADVLARAKAGAGMIPNMYANMANAPSLLDAYLQGYAGFRRDSGFTPTEQEVVFLTLSVLNRCGYCVGADSSLADRSKVPHEVTDAVRHGGPIPDERLAALSAFTRTMATTGGRPARAEVEAFLTAGYTELQVLYLILALAVKTLSNYSNHLFHTPLDTVFAAWTWEG